MPAGHLGLPHRDVTSDVRESFAAHAKYRPDIDGLRAIAVLSVVGFHAFPVTVPGGFIGVDVFFVISGFLISTILLENVATGRFTFADFYSRRIRRIFPALAVVLIATFGFGGLVLLADEYAALGKHVAAGSGFMSNFVFWNEADYFDASAESKPLLHLWSLAIEEQFYIVWPIVLCLAWRWRQNLLAVTLTIAIASFAFNTYVVGRDEVADFYSPLTRSWELMAGGLLAHVSSHRAEHLQALLRGRREALALVGLVALAAGLFLVKSTSPFPGWWALLPVVGATAIIAAGPHALVNRHVLGSRPFVWVGLISYPLYLWHWPILSFLRIIGTEHPSRTSKGIAVLLAVLLAWLTFRLVERPVRFGTRRRAMVVGLFATIVLIGSLGFACYRDGGFTFRPAADPVVVNAGEIGSDVFHDYIAGHFKTCTPAAVRDEDGGRCAQSKDGPIDVAIVGDSHAESVFVGLADALPRTNVAFYMRDAVPVMSNPRFAQVFDSVIADPSIRTVVLTAWWALRLKELPARDRVIDLQSTVDALMAAGKRVYILEDTPNFSFTPRFCKYESGFLRKNRCAEAATDQRQEQAANDAVFSALVDKAGRVERLDAARYFCDGTNCTMGGDGVLFFRDSNHLSIEGSKFLARHLLVDHPELSTLQAQPTSSE